jgi:membrane-associated protease RseP (regulator of RpoE activity)
MTSTLLLTLLLIGQAPKQQAPAKVPFDIIASKHMAVQIKVNGQGPYRVIFDTGAPVNLLSTRIGKEAGLIKGKPAAAFFGMQGMMKASELQVGELKAKDISVIVMDHPTINAISEVLGPVDGIVGFPFFARYKTAINYQDKTLTMTPTAYDPGDVLQALMKSMMSGGKERKVHVSPTTLWGWTVGKEASDEEDGVELVLIYPGGPAEKAGLKVGDRIMSIDGRWTDSVNDCYLAASLVKPGQRVKVAFRRDNETKTLELTPPAGL